MFYMGSVLQIIACRGYDDSLIDDNVSGATFHDVAWCDRCEKKTREWWVRVSSQTPAPLLPNFGMQ